MMTIVTIFMLYKYISFSYSECNRLDAFIHSLISKVILILFEH